MIKYHIIIWYSIRMENNIENDIDYTIKIMETHILNLKKKLDEER